MANSIFITGTDTGVGKTLVTELLTRYLREKGVNAVSQKWVETGVKTASRARRIPDDRRPYVFKYPASPHLASMLEKRRIGKERIKRSFRKLADKFDAVIVEGSGGLLVPLSKKDKIVDVAAELRLPVLLVAANKLGAINHTLLTIEALKNRNMKILGIVFNACCGEADKLTIRENPRIVKAMSGVDVVCELPYSENPERLYKLFSKAAGKIYP